MPRAFTLVELLVSLALIALLLSLLMPALAHTRHEANRLRCRNNLRELHAAIVAYSTTTRTMPAWCTPGDAMELPDALYRCPEERPDAEQTASSYDYFPMTLARADATPQWTVLEEMRPNHPEQNTIAWSGRLAP